MEKYRPRRVNEARYSDDRERLSAMGRKGAEVANENKREAVKEVAQKRIREEIFAEIKKERLEKEEEARRRETNEDIVPFDQDSKETDEDT